MNAAVVAAVAIGVFVLAFRVYGRYRKPGPVKVKFSAKIAGRNLTRTLDLELPEKDESPPRREDRGTSCMPLPPAGKTL